MDPITAALMAALAAGATQVGKSAVVDSYNGVKALIKKKFEKTDLPAAIENLEKKPDSKSRQGMVQEEVESANADKDPEIMSTVQALVDAVMNTPDGQKVISKYNLNIRGSDIGVIGDNADIKGGYISGKNERPVKGVALTGMSKIPSSVTSCPHLLHHRFILFTRT